jgi:cytochrome b561
VESWRPTIPDGYRRPQIVLHWLVFVVVAFLFFTGDNMSHAWHAMIKDGATAASSPWIPIHIACGLTVLIAMLARIVLRRRFGAPRPPADEAPPLRIAATGVHHLFYFLLILAPLVGLTAFFLFPPLAGLHHLLVRLPIIVLFGLHALGALWHYFFKRDNVMQRMLKPVA